MYAQNNMNGMFATIGPLAGGVGLHVKCLLQLLILTEIGMFQQIIVKTLSIIFHGNFVQLFSVACIRMYEWTRQF
jgi:hypothetical protein